MSRCSQRSLLGLVESFFQQHLRRVRGASENTQRAYRDGLRLYFLFLAQLTGRAVASLQTTDIRADTVLAFLEHLEVVRGNSATSRNCRLAAVHSFAAHLLRQDLSHAEQYQRILAIPSKKTRSRAISYLEPEEMRALLAQPDRTTALGLRDHALILFLYNTGARVSEALDVHAADLQLRRPRQVRLRGKGAKERISPLWPETAAILEKLLRSGLLRNGPIFTTLKGRTLSRDAVGALLDKYACRAAETAVTLRRRRVTPHVLRHSCAVALLQAGVDVTVIRDYLGHVSVATTSRYISTNVEMKRNVLSAFWKRSGLDPQQTKPWRPTPKLLALLASL
jgi:site-specific recombinase XerD